MATDSQTAGLGNLPTAPTTRNSSLRVRLFFSLMTSFAVMIVVTVIAFGFVIHSWEGILKAEIQRNLTQKAQMFAEQVNSDHSRSITVLTSQAGQSAGARATVIDMNGKVIADSEVRLAELDKEGRQPEFVTALRGDKGVEVRSRSAFGIPVMYVAVPVSGGAVRLAYPISDIGIIRAQAHHTLLLLALAAFVAGTVISAMVAKAVTKRLQSAAL